MYESLSPKLTSNHKRFPQNSATSTEQEPSFFAKAKRNSPQSPLSTAAKAPYETLNHQY